MILILGGTAEARTLAAALVDRGDDVESSLAGRVSAPALPAGPVRIGGFGGADGLSRYLREHRVDVLVDATHPFAARISEHARLAAALTGTPLLRLTRPGWRDHPDAGAWTWVADEEATMAAAPDVRRPFLTTGRQSLPAFLPWADRSVLARVVDPPDLPVPPPWTILRSRGPYDLDSERAVLRGHAADLLVTKDSGGPLTAAKLTAATELGVPVIVIQRPEAAEGFRTVTDLLAALDALPR